MPTWRIPHVVAHPLGGGGAERAVLFEMAFTDGCERAVIVQDGAVHTGRKVGPAFVSMWRRGAIDDFELRNGRLLNPVGPGEHDTEAWVARDLRRLAADLWEQGQVIMLFSERSNDGAKLFDLKRGVGLERFERDADCDGEQHHWMLVAGECVRPRLVWHINLEEQTVVPPKPMLVTV